MQTRATILIVDDTESNIDILVDLLDEEYDLVVALDGESALEILDEQPIDLILLDIVMPNMDGYEVSRRAKARSAAIERIPIVFITAKSDEASIEKAFDAGGMDYVTKPFKSKELFARIKTQLQIQKLIKELEASKQELKTLSERDPMTKLCNRRCFKQTSKAILELARRDESDLSLIMIDIDKFKDVNDTYGHSVGDEVLISFSQVLMKMTRKSDLLCRFGGEEFLVLLPETTLEGAAVIAEKIRKEVEVSAVKCETCTEVHYTVSLGVSQLEFKDEATVEEGIKRADSALYEAKESGRNRVVCS